MLEALERCSLRELHRRVIEASGELLGTLRRSLRFRLTGSPSVREQRLGECLLVRLEGRAVLRHSLSSLRRERCC